MGGGDSGSNVVEVTGGNDVTWCGGLWGGSSDGSVFIYSPASAIQKELGTLTVTDGGGGGGEPPLSASFTYGCRFGNCTFDASGSTGAIVSYAWAFEDGTSATGVTASHLYPTVGSYDVALTVADATGTTASATATITCVFRGSKLQCK